MYRNTRFSDVMKGLSRRQFEKRVSEHQADKHSKGFRCWDQLIALVYAQLSGSESLREVVTGFNSQSIHHYHLGTQSLKRSTLAEANAKRSAGLYADVCSDLLQQANRKLRGEVGDLLYLLDSSPISLSGPGYDEWTKDTHNHRTQGLKLHVLMTSPQNTPAQVSMTAPNVNDIDHGRQLSPEAGATYVFDKGYYDYNWWHTLTESGAYFVSRFKHNAGLNVVEQRLIPDGVKTRILEDTWVTFRHKRQGSQRINAYYGKILRRVVVHRADKPTPLVLVTNDLERSAEEIAALYKQRWGIELFFKWVKQHLKIKRFLGRSENAVKTQVYCALISYVLIQLYHQAMPFTGSLWACLVEVRAGLFQRLDVECAVIKRHQNRQQEWLKWQPELPI